MFAINYAPAITKLVRDPNVLLEYIQKQGQWGVLVFLGVQILQIVIPPIPGEVVQLAAGYIFGPWLGSFYLLLGAFIGSLISFYTSRYLGYPIVQAFVSTSKLERLRKLIEHPKTDLVVFLAFLIPGFPKDLLTYVAGLTPLSAMRFVMLALVGRFPALFVSVIVGNNLREKSYEQTVWIILFAGIIFLIGFYYRKQIFERLEIGKTSSSN